MENCRTCYHYSCLSTVATSFSLMPSTPWEQFENHTQPRSDSALSQLANVCRWTSPKPALCDKPVASSRAISLPNNASVSLVHGSPYPRDGLDYLVMRSRAFHVDSAGHSSVRHCGHPSGPWRGGGSPESWSQANGVVLPGFADRRLVNYYCSGKRGTPCKRY